MRAVLLAAVALVLAPWAAAGDPPPAPMAVAVLERDLPPLVEMFQGVWDNAEQVGFAGELGFADGAPPTRRHVTIRRVEAPGLGPLVLRLDEYRNNDPADVGRQRFYSFAVDPAKMAIRMDVLTPLGDRLPADADHAALTREGMRSNPGCETLWRRSADQFVAWIEDGACRVRSQGGSGPELTIGADIALSTDQLWIIETARDARGRDAYPDEPDAPVQYRRATAFTCWIAVPRQAPQEGWFYARDLAIHDQGGEVWVTTDETTPRTFGFRMRNVRWPTGQNADALTLYIHDQRGSPAISYAWASPDATRIGINLRTLQGSCSRGT
ncbi:chromophore lyase CpcT/CpeT [Brevundimonas bacteroides]|uniref:chromophore lyase CpcT/CpeT n=1 Tax=Brevundimonas bacteroides TaxID=74311 RepID=UPI0004955AA6|nr:chromophore lyase CpcT/CpeT [Brevundimonas bacteroides]